MFGLFGLFGQEYELLFRAIGALGLLFIIAGVLSKKKTMETKRFILGGIFLVIYSIYIRDIIFIILQLVFVAASVYEYSKSKGFLKK